MTSKHFKCAEDRMDYVDWALSEKDDLKWLFCYEQVMEDEDGTTVSGFANHHVFAKGELEGLRRILGHSHLMCSRVSPQAHWHSH